MSQNTRYKIVLNQKKRKDTNVGFFIDTTWQVSETLYLKWSKIYAIFDIDDFSSITHAHRAYAKIRNYQLHCISARTSFMSNTDPIKWKINHENPKKRCFNENTQTSMDSFHPNVFARDYALKSPQKLLNPKFLEASMSQFDFYEVIKSWMDNPFEFIPKEEKAYPFSWFREPFALLATMFCRLYGLPNYTDFKAKWDPISHRILLTGESFNWEQILSVVLK